MDSRRKRLTFAVVAAICLVAGVLAVARAVHSADAPTSERSGIPTASEIALIRDRFKDGAQVLFRDLDRTDISRYGAVSFAKLSTTPSRRMRTKLVCDRVYFAAGHGLCLAAARGAGASVLGPSFLAKLFDTRFVSTRSVRLPGIPSRARISPDGRFGAVTSFVSGHSYADPGGFSTQTTIIDMGAGKVLSNIEDYQFTKDGRRIRSPDFNLWGVTFAQDGDRFFATLGTKGKTYLVEGSVSGQRARVLVDNVECPSLSPDNTKVAFKKIIGGDEGAWVLHVLDLRTMAQTQLTETRPIDDQVEWLDNSRILYGLEDEVWVVPSDGTGNPAPFLTSAGSPAVVRS